MIYIFLEPYLLSFFFSAQRAQSEALKSKAKGIDHTKATRLLWLMVERVRWIRDTFGTLTGRFPNL